MNDCFSEDGIKQRPGKDALQRHLLILAVLLISIFGGWYLLGVFAISFIFIIAVVCVIFWKYDVEYDYTFCNDSVDIAKIINQSKRKEVISFTLDQLKIVAPTNSPRLEGYRQKQGLKRLECHTLKKDAKPYSFLVEIEKGEFEILMEPSEKSLEIIKTRTKNVFYDE